MSDRPLLILDMDETLIHASEVDLGFDHEVMMGYYVHRRPGLEQFLRRCAEHYRLAVWSSAGSHYVKHLIGRIAPSELNFEFVWDVDRCVTRINYETFYHYHVKDLKKVKRLGYDLARILMVDDTPRKLERNYGNLVRIPEFLGDPADVVLGELASYLESIKDSPDFRRMKKDGWWNFHAGCDNRKVEN